MRIIPAIDIIEGKCVRLSQGDYNTKKVYDGSPVDVAKSYEDAGIRYLHLVDLDGAKASHIVNSKVLEDICANTSLKVDFGGGIKSNEDIEIAFEAGAAQITAGSIAVKDPKLVSSWIDRFGADKIILGADVKGEKIAINGWKDDTSENIYDFVEAYIAKGIQSVISTDIATDGMLNGPSVGLYNSLGQKFPDLKVIASGGVSTTKDLDDLLSIGVDGVIIGKAIYEKRISLKELSAYVG